MPRELYLVTGEPVTAEAVIRAAAEVDDELALRGLYDGNVLQLVGAGDRAVLSVTSSRRLVDPVDLGRVTRGLADGAAYTGDPGASEVETWWTEAQAPWGPAGDPGVAVARALARRLGGRLQVEDGIS